MPAPRGRVTSHSACELPMDGCSELDNDASGRRDLGGEPVTWDSVGRRCQKREIPVRGRNPRGASCQIFRGSESLGRQVSALLDTFPPEGSLEAMVTRSATR